MFIKSNQLILILLLVCFSHELSATNYYRGLVIADENRCTEYNKEKQYPYSQSLEPLIVESMGGKIYGPYSGTYFESTKDTDIEHIVAASEAHDSGLCSATAETKKQFASDLLNLTLASPDINRCRPGGKCGYDAAEWLPSKNQCWFSYVVVLVKKKYKLSVDKAEAIALEGILSSCDSFKMVFEHADNPSEPIRKFPLDPLQKYDSNRNGRISCMEARNHNIAPVRANHPAYKYMIDRNKDGVVCE
ncbi:excalibur calcium-binding domain-containing protein [Thalassotalea marina]|uniref:Excalibur calcium-binding domain-containing protein n=1 Tax=Thalassotalea marina TaxID=1673741 RepID=A0A919EQD4_9GAMM|nr:excalibur calcium-binding domain-containing protein [Thalassotalea marina]GHG07165.1 hypothetical protein GCM10017161_41090 [Thalassotalea marina]